MTRMPLLISYTLILTAGIGCREIKDLNGDDAQNAFKRLTDEWGIEISTPYRVIHLRDDTFRDEYGCHLFFAKIEFPASATNSWVKQLHDPRVVAKDTVIGVDNDRVLPIVTRSDSKNEILWSVRPKVDDVSPKIDWWNAASNTKCFRGWIQAQDRIQHIEFYVLEGVNGAVALFETASRPGAKK